MGSARPPFSPEVPHADAHCTAGTGPGNLPRVLAPQLVPTPSNYPRTAVVLMCCLGLRLLDPSGGGDDTRGGRRPVGSGPGSLRPSSHTAPGCHGTSTAMRTSAPRPSASAYALSIGHTPSSPHRSAGCAG